MESHLVLHAAGIASDVIHREGWWLLVTHCDDAADARKELDAYRDENSPRSETARTEYPVYSGATGGVLLYSLVIVLFAVAGAPWGLDWDLLTIGRLEAGRVMAGQWWRTVTALTLHLDALHLLSNLVFGVLFGFLTGRVFGGGVAWFGIVVAGALGNLVSAVVHQPEHLSIGASTAVFAALGMLVAHAVARWKEEGAKSLRQWRPLIGGVLLLAYTGVGGERTDVVSHVTGFLAGIVIGWLACRLPNRLLGADRVQSAAGAAALVLVLLTWAIAILAARPAG